MRKVLLLAAFAVFALTSVQAQEVRLGVKGGLNVAHIGGDSYGWGSLSSRTSFHIGGFVEIPLMGDFSLQPEILYSSEGSEWGGVFVSSSALKLDYVRVPVLGKYNMPFVNGLSAELGPVFGVLVNAKAGSTDYKDDYKSFDAQIGIGATYRFNFGLEAGLRYNKGILNVNEDTDLKSQSNVFQIFAGYSF